jgi:site-specific DNA recombinase
MSDASQQSTLPQQRAVLYARLSETYDAAESVPTQLANGERHAGRRGWRVVARLKDDGYSAFKEIRRDDLVRLIEMIERDEVDVVVIRDVDRLTRNLPDWTRFEKAAIEHRVTLSMYAGGDLDLSTPEGAYYGGMETLRAKRESAVKSVRIREGKDREARKGARAGGGPRWFGYARVYANPEEPNRRRRIVLREELDSVEAAALRDAAVRVLDGETVSSILREWTGKGIRPSGGGDWTVASLVGTLTSARLAGLREWQGRKYPGEWPAVFDVDTHERLVKLFADPARRVHYVGRQFHLLSGVLRCGKCGHPLYSRVSRSNPNRAPAYGCVRGPAGGACGGLMINAELLEEFVAGAVLAALESPRVQDARTAEDSGAPRRAELLEEIRKAQEKREEARRDYADDVIDKDDWLDIKARTEARMARARKEYDRLSGQSTVFGDIPPAELVREAWEGWSTDRRRAAVKSLLHKVVIRPEANMSYRSVRDPQKRRAMMLRSIENRAEFDWKF